MMKKLIALAVALCFVCSVCLADAGKVTTATATCDEQELRGLLGQFGIPVSSASSMISVLPLLVSFSNVQYWNDGTDGGVLLSVGGLMDLSFLTRKREDSFSVQSSLFPGYSLRSENTQGLGGSLGEALMGTVSYLETVSAQCAQWLYALPCVTETGSFAGDAYQGGAVRKTWTVREHDLIILMQSMREDGLAILQVFGQSAENAERFYDGLIAGFDDGRTYHAEASEVFGQDGVTLVGLSVTLYRENEPILTVSAGIGQDAVRLVIGAGHADDVLYGDLTVRWKADRLSGSAQAEAVVFRDTARLGYPAASVDPDKVASGSWKASWAGDADAGYRFSEEGDLVQGTFTLHSQAEGVCKPAEHALQYEAGLYLNGHETPVFSVRVGTEEGEAPASFDEGAEVVDAQREDLLEDEALLTDMAKGTPGIDADIMREIVALIVLLMR